MKRFRKVQAVRFFFLTLFLTGLFLKTLAGQDVVYKVNIHGTIDLGLAHYVSRSIAEAGSRGGKGIILEINTFGGRVDAATEIRDAIYASRIPVVAFVDTRAWSAGALIALACPKIIMSPGSSIGAAEPMPSTAKNISALVGEFRSEAERYHRNPDIAAGMVDPGLTLSRPAKKQGEILTLTAEEAVKDGFAEKVADNETGVLAYLGWSKAKVLDVPLTASENLARGVTDPDISTILLTIGMLGIAVEIMTQHAVAGIIGLLALGLLFGGHLIANLSDTWFLLLFVLGIGLMLFELHVLPGHGVSGILGIGAILASFFFVLGGNALALKQIALSMAIAAVIFILLLRYLPKSPVFGRLILKSNLETPVPSIREILEAKDDLKSLIGKTGTTVSELHPSGIVLIENKRYSAITEGDFIPANNKVKVRRLQGSSLVVFQAE